MTLRARLTGAFLAVVLGPVLLGAVFVADTVSSANQEREEQRLEVAVASLRTAVGATCDRMQAVAEAAAALTLGGTQPAAAQTLVTQGAAGAIMIESGTGTPIVTTPGAPGPPWALCTRPDGDPVPAGGTDFQALAAAVEMRDVNGNPVGYAYAAQPLDAAYIRQVSGSAGVDVTLLADPGRSTRPVLTAAQLIRYAGGMDTATLGRVAGTYVRRVDVLSGELTFLVSVPVSSSRGLILVVGAVVLIAAMAAVGAANALARGTTRPLEEIAEAADRVAGGDLTTRVPVRHDDEVGQLGAAFNRMTREMRRYVEALTASRDQLRGNLERLGDTLSSTHDLPRILRVILASAVCATGAQAGMVLLAGEDGELRFHCGEGFDPSTAALLESLTVAPGAGLLGAVAATGTASRGRISGPATGTKRLMLAAGEPVCRTYLAVPLRVPGRAPVPAQSGAEPAERTGGAVHGVIALYDRVGDDDFDDTDLRTVLTFAGHAAVAVDNVRLHDEARRLSHTDALTGLYNYRHLKDLLRREVNRSTRFGHPLCAVTLDLDHFKEVNDTYGHAAGDAVLVEFAHRVGMEIRGVDFAFRAGGEEFVLLLPETDALGGVTLARRLGAAVRGTTFTVRGGPSGVVDADELPGDEIGANRPGAGGDAGQRTAETVGIRVTASIGVAVFPDHGSTGAQLLQAADEALYGAKAAGRDTYRLAASRSGAPGTAVPGEEFDREAAGAGGPARSAPAGDVPGGPGPGVNGRGRGTDRQGQPTGGASGGPHPPRQSRGR